MTPTSPPATTEAPASGDRPESPAQGAQLEAEEDRSWRRELTTYAVALVLFLGGLMLTNVVVDPRGEFPPDVFPPVPWSDAAYKLELLEEQGGADLLIFGSSRSQKLDPASFTDVWNGTGFNFGVGASAITEVEGLLRLIIEGGHAPERILVALDADRFHPEAKDHARLGGLASPVRTGDAGPIETFQAALGTLSPWYILDTVRSIALMIHGEDLFGADVVIHPDGTTNFERKERAMAKPGFNATDAAARTYKAHLGFYTETPALDPAALGKLDDLIELARAEGIRVHLFLTPYHPVGLERLREQGFEEDVEELVSFILARCGPDLSFQDFSDLEDLSGDPDAFMDAIHYTGINIERITTALINGQDDQCASAVSSS